MRKWIGFWLAVVVIGALAGGCDRKPNAKSGVEAIEIAENLRYENEQIDYLLAQAERFLRNYRYQDAIVVANYILDEYDRNPMLAKVILERAKKGLEERTKEMRLYQDEILEGWHPPKAKTP